MQDITWKINKPKMTLKTFYIPFLFKSIKCMDTIRVVQSLYYESMMWILCLKPSSFCANKPLLYSCNVLGILIRLIFLGGGIFLNDYNNVVFTWILCARNMTIDNKVADLGLIYIPLCLQCHVFMFTVLQIIIEQCNCCILFLNGLSVLFIKPQNFLLMFLIRKLKGLDTVCKIFNFHRM